MNRQIFIKHISDKRFIFRIYKNSHNSRIDNNLVLKTYKRT